jgi:tetratricopeptide (TPR) repeat protein
MRRALSGLVLCALLAAPAAAATLKLKDGTRVECKVKSYDSATQTLHVTTADGKDQSYTMAQLDGRSVYQINSSLVPPKDAKAQLLAANFARDAGLYSHAVRRYAQALELDPNLKGQVDAEMKTLRRAAAGACMDRARTSIAKGDTNEAEKYLKILVEKLPSEPEADQAASMLDQYYAQNRATKIAAADQKAAETLKKDVATGKKRYEQMVEKTRKGLQARGSSQAEGLFKGAINDGEAVLSELDAVEKKYSDDASLRSQASNYREVVTQQMVEVHLHMASALATHSDYQGAQGEINQALSLDPRNEQALSMRARVEEYSSRGIGWGWR